MSNQLYRPGQVNAPSESGPVASTSTKEDGKSFVPFATSQSPLLKTPEERDRVSAGVKHDAEKPPLDLIPPEALFDEAMAWNFGAKKYGRYNFRAGIAYTRLLAALLRHAYALVKGEDNDPESGLPHEAHIRCCAGMLAVMKKTRKDLDDRYRSPLQPSEAKITVDRSSGITWADKLGISTKGAK